MIVIFAAALIVSLFILWAFIVWLAVVLGAWWASEPEPITPSEPSTWGEIAIILAGLALFIGAIAYVNS